MTVPNYNKILNCDTIWCIVTSQRWITTSQYCIVTGQFSLVLSNFPPLPCHTVICWTLASQCSIGGVTSCQILTSQCSSCTWQLSVTSQNWNEELKHSVVHDKAPLHHCIVTSMHRWLLPSSVGIVFLLWRTWSWLLGFVVWVCVLFWFGLVCRNVEDFRT